VSTTLEQQQNWDEQQTEGVDPPGAAAKLVRREQTPLEQQTEGVDPPLEQKHVHSAKRVFTETVVSLGELPVYDLCIWQGKCILLICAVLVSTDRPKCVFYTPTTLPAFELRR